MGSDGDVSGCLLHLDDALRLGQVDTVRTLIRKGLRLSTPLRKADLEVIVPRMGGAEERTDVWQGRWEWESPEGEWCMRRPLWRMTDDSDSDWSETNGGFKWWDSGEHEWQRSNDDLGACLFGWDCRGI